jgi:hypothetical protein
MPKHLYINRESLNQKIRIMNRAASCGNSSKYLTALNLSIDDIKFTEESEVVGIRNQLKSVGADVPE